MSLWDDAAVPVGTEASFLHEARPLAPNGSWTVEAVVFESALTGAGLMM